MALPAIIHDEQYEHHLSKSIGSGRWSEVYEASTFHAARFIRRVAVKVKPRKQDSQDYLEGYCHSNLYHPHIVDIHQHFDFRDWNILVLDICTHVTLLSWFESRGTLTLVETARLMIQLLRALKYVESRGYTHRDVKPSNILLDGHNNVKLADFNLADVVNNKFPLTKFGGTSAYAAPEVFQPPPTGYTACCDIWSAGVIMYQVLTGRLPFPSPDATVRYEYDWDIRYTDNPAYDQARSIVGDILVPAGNRPTADQIVSQPFFVQSSYLESWDSVYLRQAPAPQTKDGHRDKQLYYSICRAAGVGQDEAGRPYACVGRDRPLQPLSRYAGGDLQLDSLGSFKVIKAY